MPSVEQRVNSDFIEIYEDALDEADCGAIIKQFETCGQAKRGAVGSGVNTDLKDSWDICIDHEQGWQPAVQKLNGAMAYCLMRYLRKHAYALLAPLTLKMTEPGSNTPVLLTPEHLARLDSRRFMALITKVFRPGAINVQKYEADQGGYPYWHCEHYPKNDDEDTLHRVLLWSVYLNQSFTAGETEFFHQQRKITPRTGTLLIAPAGFTHTHRGNRPCGGDKYLATSWILFQRAEKLYAQV